MVPSLSLTIDTLVRGVRHGPLCVKNTTLIETLIAKDDGGTPAFGILRSGGNLQWPVGDSADLQQTTRRRRGGRHVR